MPAPIIRCDFDALSRIAAMFNQQAEATTQTSMSLKNAMETLANGDWIGVGARKYYEEMTSDVMPALGRLSDALLESSQTIQKTSSIMERADEDAARLLAGEPSLLAMIRGGIRAAVDAVEAALGEEGAVDRELQGFDPKVREIAKKSPSLRTMLQKASEKGWTIKVGKPGKGSWADSDHKQIIVDPNDSHAYQVSGIAHELGHALYKVPYHNHTPGMTKNEFVRLNVQEEFRGEANSMLAEHTVRQEILKNGGPDVDFSGGDRAAQQKIFNDYQNGNISRTDAQRQMAALIGNWTTSGDNPQKYTDYYGSDYVNTWNREVGAGRTVK